MFNTVFTADLAEAKKLLEVGKKDGLTPSLKARIQHHIALAEKAKEDQELGDEIEAMRTSIGGVGGKGGLGDQLVNSGFNLKHNRSVEFSAYAAFQAKAPTLPATTVLNPMSPSVVAMGQDSRFLWPNLTRQDAGNATAVSDFRQTARTVTGSVKRAIDATTDKVGCPTLLGLRTH